MGAWTPPADAPHYTHTSDKLSFKKNEIYHRGPKGRPTLGKQTFVGDPTTHRLATKQWPRTVPGQFQCSTNCRLVSVTLMMAGGKSARPQTLIAPCCSDILTKPRRLLAPSPLITFSGQNHDIPEGLLCVCVRGGGVHFYSAWAQRLSHDHPANHPPLAKYTSAGEHQQI